MSDVKTDRIELQVEGAGAMHAFVARPADWSGGPAILVLQEAFGVNAHIRDVAGRYAKLGLLAIAPELFHRTSDGFEGNYTDFEPIRPQMEALTTEGLVADMSAAHAWLLGAGVANDRIAAVGFCMGGRAAYLANARLPLRAAISYYGGGIAGPLLDEAKTQHGPILMYWGGKDQHVLPEHYRAVADALTAGGATHEQVVFGQADHGFNCDVRASYNADASRQAWALSAEFLRVTGVL